MVPKRPGSARRRWLNPRRRCRGAALKPRSLIIVTRVNGRSAATTAEVLKVGRSTVYAVAQRFRTAGEAGVVDRREENGPRKLGARYPGTLYEVVRSDPPDHGWRRPRWTRATPVPTPRRETRPAVP